MDPERIQDYRAGVIALALVAFVLVGVFVFAISDFFGAPKSQIRAHFRQVSGLGENSKINLGGKPVGRVQEVTFVEPHYPCDPETEDGPSIATRTEACEAGLFCVPVLDVDERGRCAELLPFSGHDADYASTCGDGIDCAPGDVCLDDEFFLRNTEVYWPGPEYVCATYTIEHRRVEVRMAIDEDKLPYVRTDSLATVASKGPLGESIVNITVGSEGPVAPGGLIRSGPTLFEELGAFRDRFAAMGGRVRQSFGDFEGTTKRSREFGTPEDVERTIASLRATTDDMVMGRGSMSGLFGHDSKARLPGRLASFRDRIDSFERSLRRFDRETAPRIREVAKGAATLEGKLAALSDPNADGAARWFSDPRLGNEIALGFDGFGPKANAAEARIVDVRDALRALDEDLRKGEGLMHELFVSPKLYYTLVKALGNTERNDVLKATVRDTIAEDEQKRAKQD